MPTYVVSDDDDVLVVYLPTGAEFGFPDSPLPWTHPWRAAGHTEWSGHGKLMLHRRGDAYSVDVFWRDPDRRFAGWYINLQDPIRRTADGFATLDHELDLWMPHGGEWRMKDEELFEQRVREGRYPPAQADAIRAEGRRVFDMVVQGRWWWDEGWSAWSPPKGWGPLRLPAGWDADPGPRDAAELWDVDSAGRVAPP